MLTLVTLLPLREATLEESEKDCVGRKESSREVCTRHGFSTTVMAGCACEGAQPARQKKKKWTANHRPSGNTTTQSRRNVLLSPPHRRQHCSRLACQTCASQMSSATTTHCYQSAATNAMHRTTDVRDTRQQRPDSNLTPQRR